jgi:hypothetical protein
MKIYIGNYPKWTFFRRFLCCIGLEKLANSKLFYGKKIKIKIKIHEYDSWSADHSLSLIAVPLLKQLRKTTHGYPCDLNSPEEWDLILSKIIWAHEQVIESAEDDFYIVKGELSDNWGKDMVFDSIWKVKPILNAPALMAYQERIDEGLELFGKYYQHLWD